jgi:hypothetical protein
MVSVISLPVTVTLTLFCSCVCMWCTHGFRTNLSCILCTKSTQFTPPWNRRYFSVHRDELRYYDCEKRLELKGVFPLLSIKSIQKIRSGRSDVYSFQISMQYPDERVLSLRSRTKEDAERWIRGLALHISCWKDARDVGTSTQHKKKKGTSERMMETDRTLPLPSHHEHVCEESSIDSVPSSSATKEPLNLDLKSLPQRRRSREAWTASAFLESEVISPGQRSLDDLSRPSTSRSIQSTISSQRSEGSLILFNDIEDLETLSLKT